MISRVLFSKRMMLRVLPHHHLMDYWLEVIDPMYSMWLVTLGNFLHLLSAFSQQFYPNFLVSTKSSMHHLLLLREISKLCYVFLGNFCAWKWLLSLSLTLFLANRHHLIMIALQELHELEQRYQHWLSSRWKRLPTTHQAWLTWLKLSVHILSHGRWTELDSELKYVVIKTWAKFYKNWLM